MKARLIGLLSAIIVSGVFMQPDTDIATSSDDRATAASYIIDDSPETKLIDHLSDSFERGQSFHPSPSSRIVGKQKRNQQSNNFPKDKSHSRSESKVYISHAPCGYFPSVLFTAHTHLIALRNFRN